MLDKVELRVPGRTAFQPDFQWIEKEVPFAGQASPIRRSVRYQGAVDLRPFGFDAMLHAYFKRKIRRPHKLELFRTGRKSLAEMTRIVAAIFDADPNNLENMRLDFTADLHDIPVEYLHNSVRVKFKRSSNEHGELDYEEIGRKRLEYFRYGVSPNCVRVYDKVAECKARLPEAAIAMRASGESVTFESAFGFPADATVSRVERQAGGGRVPKQLLTFGDLWSADDFNPFANIEIIPDVPTIPDPDQYGESVSLNLIGVRTLIQERGLQNARAYLNRNGNANRYLDAYTAYAKQCKSEFDISTATLLETYRKSIRKQIDGTVAHAEAASAPSTPARNTAIDMLGGLADNAPHEITG